MAKRSRKRKKLLGKRVFSYKQVEPWTYSFVEATRFIPCYTEKQRDEIALAYSEFAGGTCYNSPLICLEDIHFSKMDSPQEIELSIGCFYDFLLTNIIGGMKDDRFLRYCSASGHDRQIVDVVDKLMNSYRDEQRKIHSFESLVSTTHFPNVLAVSALMHDHNGVFLLSRRTDNVILGKGLLGVTVTGSVEVEDIKNANPFYECAARELAEETGIVVLDRNMRLRGMVASLDKLQPVGLVDIFAEQDVSEFETNLLRAESDELASLIGMEAASMLSASRTYDMTEVAREHCRRAALPFITQNDDNAQIESVDHFFKVPA